MSTRWEDGDILTSCGPNGMDCDIFDVADEDGRIDVLIYFPEDVWDATQVDEDEQLELINEYTFPYWCISDASWEEAPGDADADEGQVCIEARIRFDLTD